MALVVFPHHGFPEREVPPRTLRQGIEYTGVAFWKGLTSFGGKLAALSGLVGGSVLAYAIFVANLSLPWVLLIGVAVLSLIYGIGAYRGELESSAADIHQFWGLAGHAHSE